MDFFYSSVLLQRRRFPFLGGDQTSRQFEHWVTREDLKTCFPDLPFRLSAWSNSIIRTPIFRRPRHPLRLVLAAKEPFAALFDEKSEGLPPTFGSLPASVITASPYE
jgi:hypothetical protein